VSGGEREGLRYPDPIDWSLAHFLNNAVASRDWLEDPVTTLASAAVPAFAAVAVGLWLLSRPYADTRWKRASVSALASAALAMLTNQVISHLWQRPRPFDAHAGVELLASKSVDPSFPSDHAAAAFAIAVAVLLLSRRAGLPLLVLAVFVAFSRVALGVHYPSDVLAGAAIGALAAFVVATLGAPSVRGIVGLASRPLDPVYARVLSLGRSR
jgi:undecaprenyl-diphosphatase